MAGEGEVQPSEERRAYEFKSLFRNKIRKNLSMVVFLV